MKYSNMYPECLGTHNWGKYNWLIASSTFLKISKGRTGFLFLRKFDNVQTMFWIEAGGKTRDLDLKNQLSSIRPIASNKSHCPHALLSHIAEPVLI